MLPSIVIVLLLHVTSSTSPMTAPLATTRKLALPTPVDESDPPMIRSPPTCRDKLLASSSAFDAITRSSRVTVMPAEQCVSPLPLLMLLGTKTELPDAMVHK